MAERFSHLQDSDAATNGPKRLTECGIYVRTAACVRREAVTCPACIIVRDRQDGYEAECQRRADALGISVEALLFGRYSDDDPPRQADWPQVPR